MLARFNRDKQQIQVSSLSDYQVECPFFPDFNIKRMGIIEIRMADLAAIQEKFIQDFKFRHRLELEWQILRFIESHSGDGFIMFLKIITSQHRNIIPSQGFANTFGDPVKDI